MKDGIIRNDQVKEPELPTRTLSFVFTDIEASTRLADEIGPGWVEMLEEYRRMVEEVGSSAGGSLFGSAGDGLFLAFANAPQALLGAVEIQQTARKKAPEDLRVRIGVHTGDVAVSSHGYVGLALHRTARICAAAHGGQILVSKAAREAAGGDLPAGSALHDLGAYRLKDFPEPQNLYELTQPDLPSEFPRPRALPATLNNLPPERTSFVGRTEELQEVTGLLEESRLVTLTGSGGSGKTRLSLQAAAAVMDRFPDGVWFVELASLLDPALVPGRVASVLGVREQPRRSIDEVLSESLAEKRLLIVLDNCEHLVGACALITDRLIRTTEGVWVLASSRQPLGIAGERSWPVPALTLPDPEHLISNPDLEQFDALRLFLERALEADPTFQLGDGDAAAIAEICKRLDGIPLAIELAAARIPVLSPRQIADRIGDRFRLLVGGPRGAPDRQQTLRATIDWSHDLLSEAEQTFLRRASIFPGGFTLDAAEHVCGFGAIPSKETLDLLSRLVEKSILSVERGADSMRYRLNETTREYGLERLDEAGETRSLVDRLRDWCLAIVQEAEPHLTGPDQKRWLDVLHDEIDNLRAALTSSLAGRQVQPTLELSSALLRYWMVRGSWSEGQKWLRSALELENEAPAPTRLKALRSAGVLADLISEYDLALFYNEAQLSLARDYNDPAEIADALLNLARNAYRRGEIGRAQPIALEAMELLQSIGDRESLARALEILAQVDPAEARRLLEQALAIMREVGDAETVSGMLMRLGGVLAFQGDWAAARNAMEESLSIARQLGYNRYIARCTQSLGEIAVAEGDFDRGLMLIQEAESLWPSVGHRNAMAEVVRDIGQIALLRGDLETAEAKLTDALARFRELGMRLHEGWTLRDLGALALEKGDPDQAEAHLKEALNIAASLPDAFGMAHALEGMAAVRMARGDGSGAARTLGSAEAIREASGMPLPPVLRKAVDEVTATAREVLGQDEFASSFAEGRGSRLEDTLAALSVPQPGSTIGRGVASRPKQTLGRRPQQAIFRRDGDYFTIAYDGPPFRFRDSKGLRYIAALLARPDREIHALDLVGVPAQAGRAQPGEVPQSLASSDAGELLDAEAKRAYRRRLDDLREEIREAESFNDSEREARLREEMAFLSHELAAGVGLGGRDRRAASTSERARQNVTRAIRLAIGKLGDTNPSLGAYLDTTIKTGTYCSYRPDPRFPTVWIL